MNVAKFAPHKTAIVFGKYAPKCSTTANKSKQMMGSIRAEWPRFVEAGVASLRLEGGGAPAELSGRSDRRRGERERR